jgi:uncharacterized membrane protein YeaQ/YmgE (transglycosylase-associated protein family)
VTIIAWTILGLVAGFIASKIVNKTGEGFILDILLVIAGTVTGGWLFELFWLHDATGLNIYSLAATVCGGVVLLVLHHAVLRRVYLFFAGKKS